MSNEITIHIDDQSYGSEGEQFAAWCGVNGYTVRRVPHVDGASDGHNALWERYCDAPAAAIAINYAVSNYDSTGDAEIFETRGEAAEFLAGIGLSVFCDDFCVGQIEQSDERGEQIASRDLYGCYAYHSFDEMYADSDNLATPYLCEVEAE